VPAGLLLTALLTTIAGVMWLRARSHL
jgi:hypothetical protein